MHKMFAVFDGLQNENGIKRNKKLEGKFSLVLV